MRAGAARLQPCSLMPLVMEPARWQPRGHMRLSGSRRRTCRLPGRCSTSITHAPGSPPPTHIQLAEVCMVGLRARRAVQAWHKGAHKRRPARMRQAPTAAAAATHQPFRPHGTYVLQLRCAGMKHEHVPAGLGNSAQALQHCVRASATPAAACSTWSLHTGHAMARTCACAARCCCGRRCSAPC